jgi:hypothetical protein
MMGTSRATPRKATQAILKIVDLAEPPLRLPLGNDALAFLRYGYKNSTEEVERWPEITASIDFDGLTITGHAVQEALKGK